MEKHEGDKNMETTIYGAYGLWPLELWDCGFKPRWRHENISELFCFVLPCMQEALRLTDPLYKESYRTSKDSLFHLPSKLTMEKGNKGKKTMMGRE
jgi:hypothetical protein